MTFMGNRQQQVEADGVVTYSPRLIHLRLPIGFATADAAVLWTLPAGSNKVIFTQFFWEVTTAFTGGTASAIGVSSNNAAHNTKGDLLGGVAGDVAAALTAGFRDGTAGVNMAADGAAVLDATNTLRFDRIVSAFTAGAGFVHAIGYEHYI